MQVSIWLVIFMEIADFFDEFAASQRRGAGLRVVEKVTVL